jgi:hypothetical protein
LPVSDETGPINLVVLAVAVLLTFDVVAFVATAISPDLYSKALLEIVDPLAFVLRTILVVVGATTLGFIFLPLA